VEGLTDTGISYLDDLFDVEVGENPEEVLREAADLASMAYEYLSEMAGSGMEDLPFPVVPPVPIAN
jgi:hypothetical protein